MNKDKEPIGFLVHGPTTEAFALALRHELKVVDFRILDRDGPPYTYLYIKYSKRSEKRIKQLEVWA